MGCCEEASAEITQNKGACGDAGSCWRVFCYLPAMNVQMGSTNSQKVALVTAFSFPSVTELERKLYVMLMPNESLSKSRDVELVTPRWMLLLNISALNVF